MFLTFLVGAGRGLAVHDRSLPMKSSEIVVGGEYVAKVNDKLTTVRVEAVQQVQGFKREETRYDVLNLKTGKRTTFRSAAKFRSPASSAAKELKPRRQLTREELGLAMPSAAKASALKDAAAGGLFDDCDFDAEEEPCPFAEPTSETVAAATTTSSATPKAAPATEDLFRGNSEAANGTLPFQQAGQMPAVPTSPHPSSPDCAAATTAVSNGQNAGSTGPACAPFECDCGMPESDSSDDDVCMQCGGRLAPVAVPAPTSLAAMLEKARPNTAGLVKGLAPHVLVEARAGSGKTTTLVEGLKRVKGLPSKLVPSLQQAAVWKAMAQGPAPSSICFCAFNKSIATELQSRVPQGCDAMTLHSLGFKAVNRAFRGLRVNEYRVKDLIVEVLGRDLRQLRRDKPVLLEAAEKLVGLCKVNLSGTEPEDLDQLISHYDVDLDGCNRYDLYDLVPKVLELCKDPMRDGKLDFTDMIWLPVILDLPVYQYDLLLVDEAQDLNRCQQSLARKAGKRLVLCGDPKQAIYGFAGADSDSMPRMARELAETERGCVTLPLTVTRRCSKAVVREANKVVEDFHAHEGNAEGAVGQALYSKDNDGRSREVAKTYLPLVQEGDFVLCRVNAPLVQECFRFLKMGRKANIQGRDVGQGLISTVKKVMPGEADRAAASSAVKLVELVEQWAEREVAKEQAKKNPSENRIIALQDRADCLVCFTTDADTVAEVLRKIENVFTDDKNKPGIRLSSIHKAKGLESRSVFFLMPKGAGCPHPMARGAWQRVQEMNCLYVGVTRAIENLTFVYS
jgi:DNA helicase II / ATP-dependent DNA helicase PcrA